LGEISWLFLIKLKGGNFMKKLLIQITPNKKVKLTGNDAPTLLGFLQLKPSEFKYNFQREVMQKLLKYDIQNTALNQHTS
jgi:hypothetical protein